MTRPRFVYRESLGGHYIHKILGPDGVYRDASRVKFSPEFTARLREVALADVARIRAAKLGKPQTNLIQ